jgi:hypothetical protein
MLLLSSTAVAGPRYSLEVRPILSDNCFKCHGPDEAARKGKLRLDLEADARRVLEAPTGNGEFWKRISSTNPDEIMPPPDSGKRLAPEQIEVLRAWLDAGAGYETHWAFIPPRKGEIPAVQNEAWCRNTVDRFILARLEAEQMAPSPEADRVTLIRRVHLDLTGLPPTPEEVQDFVMDMRPEAYDRVVDHLLNSPHYGERWARHWLDGARYADSNGYSVDAPRTMWPYRDWVIHALNRDMPFDQFTIEQFAGDLLPQATQEQRIATGFHRNTMINQEGGVDMEEFRLEAVMDRLNTTGAVFLGLTLSCARCHTHKYDPITQTEYFRMLAFLNNDDEPVLELPTPEQEKRKQEVMQEVAALEEELRSYLAQSLEARATWEQSLSSDALKRLDVKQQEAIQTPPQARSPEQEELARAAFRKADPAAKKLDARIERARKKLPDITATLVLAARDTPRTTHVLTQGDYTRPAEAVSPGVPAILPAIAENASSRLDFARWLVSPENPLTARVTVNRVWMRLFGKGIVETENDFGTQGSPPTHPELLDWLAVEFMEQGWSMKSLLRTLVTSATYRQASHARSDLETRDPRNLLLARQNRLRLDAEVIRDAALSVSGLLNDTIGGPSVFPPQPDGVMTLGQQDRPWKASTGPDRYRRGLYTFFWRATPHPALTVFDAPDAQFACTRRNSSTTPLQALTLLNNAAYYEFAQAFADRLARECSAEVDARLNRAFMLATGRTPTLEEAAILRALLEKEAVHGDKAAWTALARALLNLDEFITRE